MTISYSVDDCFDSMIDKYSVDMRCSRSEFVYTVFDRTLEYLNRCSGNNICLKDVNFMIVK